MKLSEKNHKTFSNVDYKVKKIYRRRVKSSNNGKVVELGKHVVSDPKICHGYLTFKGTRIMVGPVLAALAEGRNKKSILRSWPRLTWEAVQEAQMLAVHRLVFDFTGGKRLWLAYLQDAMEKTSKN